MSSDSHEKLPGLFWVQLVLVAIVAILYLLAPSAEKHGESSSHEDKSHIKAASENLKPVGKVALHADASASSGSVKARSGEQVFNAACSACHTAGVANAPKPDDKAAWEPRVAQGLDVMLKTAINGKGAMPPRGGNPANTDADIKAAILYMTKRAGFDLASSETGAKQKPEKTATVEAKVDQSTHNVTPATPAQQPETATPTGSGTTKTDTSTANVPSNITPATAQNAVPEPASIPEAKVVSVTPPKPVSAPVAPTPPTAPLPALTNPDIPAPVEPVAPTAITNAATPTPPVEPPIGTQNKLSLVEGEKVYNHICFSCHVAGVAGAPRLDDKAAWAPRIATGKDALYHSALMGKGVMPPKGGNTALSDNEVKAAVNYMISQAQ